MTGGATGAWPRNRWALLDLWAVPAGAAVAVATLTIVAGWQGADVPAHLFRVALFRETGFNLLQNQWYSGHHTVVYSLLFPAIGSLVSAPVLAVASLGVSVACFHGVAHHLATQRPARAATVLFAAGMVSNIVVGRYTFQLGVALALAAALAALRGRWRLALLAGTATSLASPVAGAFVALVALAAAGSAWWEAPRPRWRHPGARRWAALSVAAAAPVVVLSWLFPSGGWFPYAAGAFTATMLATAAVVVLVPSRPVRVGAVLYAVAAAGAFVVPTPMGANTGRLGMYLALPLLAITLWATPRRWLLVAIVPAALAWQWVPAADAIARAPADPSMHAEYYEPLLDFLEAAAPEGTRVEIPFTKRHWEATHVASRVALARGWERQLDLERNPLFYDEAPLTGMQYLAWLRELGVRFVALPDAELDRSAEQEAALLAAGLPGLRPVWGDRHWQVWEVTGTEPLVEGSARLARLGLDEVVLEATGPGSALVRVRYSRYWEADGDACVVPGPHDWVVVHTAGRGRVVLTPSLEPVVSLGVVPADRCPAPQALVAGGPVPW